MSAAHAPGPWTNFGRQPNTPGLPHAAVAGRTLLARVYSEAYGDTAQEKANADLMAAAPDLLAALYSARRLIAADRESFALCNGREALQPDDDPALFETIGELTFERQDAAFIRTYDTALAQIDAAIAKATGEAA